MKKFFAIVSAVFATVLIGCNSAHREPGRAYMPDMAYSRAVETYAATDNLKNKGINYNGLPVPGTIARGALMPYALKNDSLGYVQSASVTNPLTIGAIDMTNAERLYLVNCGICHGPKLDGNGPLWKGGDGPYPSAPKDLLGDAVGSKMTAGQMFYSVTYGKNAMGS